MVEVKPHRCARLRGPLKLSAPMRTDFPCLPSYSHSQRCYHGGVIAGMCRFCAAFASQAGPQHRRSNTTVGPTRFFGTWLTSRVPCLCRFVRFSPICLTCPQMAAEDGCFSFEVPVSDEGCGQDLRDGSQLRRQHGHLHQGMVASSPLCNLASRSRPVEHFDHLVEDECLPPDCGGSSRPP